MLKIDATSPESKSADIVAGNIMQLQKLFPEAFNEGGIDFEVLKQLLGGAIDEQEEKWGLNWHGKRRARQAALTPSSGTLRPCVGDSLEWETTGNLMIEGDNLEVLKLLQKSYHGQIKMIYIDPPYNTGNDFIYPDDYTENLDTYLQYTGQVDADKRKYSTNTETDGRFHSKWLNMMYPRLFLARNLLRDDGVIFISIDDHELQNLQRICDEIFGEQNFIGLFVVNSSPSAIDYGHIAKMNDYVLFYAKDIEMTETTQLPEEDKVFKYQDSTGPFNLYPLYNGNVAFNPKTRPNLFYPFYLNPSSKLENGFFEISLTPNDGWVEVLPVVSRKDSIQRVWRWGKELSRQNLNGEIVGYKTEDGEYRIVQKTRHTGKVIRSLQIDKDISTRRGTAEVEELLGAKVFPFPKSMELIRRFVAVAAPKDGIVLDFFAGSGTTAHAVLEQNKRDQGTRKFILVQLPEPTERKDYSTITEITKERLRRTVKMIRDESPLFSGDLGFRVFKLDSSNIRAWEPDRENLPKSLLEATQHLKSERSEQDILFELLLKLGLDLTVPIEEKVIAGKSVYSIGSGILIVCLAEKIVAKEVDPVALGIVGWYKELAPVGEVTCVFRDSSFNDDVVKTNLTTILEQHGLENVRSL